MTRDVVIVPHTHWDREWYAAFQTFRLRLVDLLDDLLPGLDAEPSFGHFMLDGQMAVVDDYLAVRPEADATLRRLAASGRLSVGPWYILMDEFLVSGETTVRNLQMGLDRAASFGGGMEVGYLPDMFGHVAQMPQLLRQFGFEHAVVWRGVPSEVDRNAFWWTAPDGSTVRAEYLVNGYGNGARLPDDAKALLEQIDSWASEFDGLVDGPILWMNGTDHLTPQLRLGRLVAEANDLQDDYALRVGSLPSYLDAAPTDGLPSWTGELRSGARANLLMGVTSNRVDVRAACAAAERALETAEATAALFMPPERWPGALLHEAWVNLVRNSAHDSICACSIDEVCDAVLHRYAEARQVADGLVERAVASLGRSVEGDGPLVINPTARPRSGVVEVIVPGNGGAPGAQVIEERPADRVVGEVDLADMAAVVVRELKHNMRLQAIALQDVDSGEILWRTERDAQGEMLPPGTRAELDALAASRSGRVLLRVTAPPTQKLLVRVTDVPGYGWRTWQPESLDVDEVRVEGQRVLDNGIVRVEVAEDGTWSLNGRPGYGRLVHGGDIGDTYNWCPPDDDVERSTPERVTVTVVEEGVLRSTLRIVATCAWPSRHGGPLVDVDVTTTLSLHVGEAFVRATTAWDNRTRDQRVRVWLPLPAAADRSEAECAFAIVTRGVETEGGPTEMALPTHPARRFVRAGGLTAGFDRVLEYELVDVHDGAAHAIALTLARCTGLISQGPMTTRPLPAGPMTPAEGAQLQQPIAVRYVVSDAAVDPYALVDEAFVPLLVSKTAGGASGTRPADGQGLGVEGAVVSSVRRVAGRLEVRVFNPSDDVATVTVDGRTGWRVDLRGRPVEPFTGSFDLEPWRIATAVLD